MVSRKEALERIHTVGVIAVLRGVAGWQVEPCLEALIAGGVDCIELSIITPDCLNAFREVRQLYGERIVLGAGSVFNSHLATLAAGLDVDFISSPGADSCIVTMCQARDILSFPGAMTPTEVMRAWHAGADLVKIIPADVLGPRYVQHLKYQFPGADLVAAGGVNEANLVPFLRAGATAVMASSAVLDHALIDAGHYAALTAQARRLRSLVDLARSQGPYEYLLDDLAA